MRFHKYLPSKPPPPAYIRTGDPYGLGTTRTLKSFEERVGVVFHTATVTSPDARNAFRPATDFNDSVASGLEGMLGILRAQMGGTGDSGGAADGGGGGAPAEGGV